MSARIVSMGARSLLAASTPMRSAAARNFTNSARKSAEATTTATVIPPAPRKPVGAFRSGIFGFLLGSTLAGGGVYGYVLQEYKASNELLTEDIYALNAHVSQLSKYVQALEGKMDAAERKRK